MNHECSRCGSDQPIKIECNTCSLEFCFFCSDQTDVDCCPSCNSKNIFHFVI